MSSRVLRSHLSHLVRNVNASQGHRLHLHQPPRSSANLLTSRPAHHHLLGQRQFRSSSSSRLAEQSRRKSTWDRFCAASPWLLPLIAGVSVTIGGCVYFRYILPQHLTRWWKRVCKLPSDAVEKMKTSGKGIKGWEERKKKKRKLGFEKRSQSREDER